MIEGKSVASWQARISTAAQDLASRVDDRFISTLSSGDVSCLPARQ